MDRFRTPTIRRSILGTTPRTPTPFKNALAAQEKKYGPLKIVVCILLLFLKMFLILIRQKFWYFYPWFLTFKKDVQWTGLKRLTSYKFEFVLIFFLVNKPLLGLFWIHTFFMSSRESKSSVSRTHFLILKPTFSSFSSSYLQYNKIILIFWYT